MTIDQAGGMQDTYGYGIALWSTAAWRQTAVEWLDDRLGAAGMRRTGAVAQPHLRPWATALRAPTTGGVVWMKAAGPATAFEAGLYEVLGRVAPGHLLRAIATDAERGWMLLEDGGDTVADRLEGDELLDTMALALGRYAELQRLAAPHAGELVALGATDMRPAVLPERFEQALAAMYRYADRAGSAGGRERLRRVEALRPDVARWCQELAQAPGASSIDHNDLSADNVFLGPPPRVYDWGDSVVAHPFATMLGALHFMRENRLECAPDDPRLLRLRDAYLDGFSDLASRSDLLRTLHLARRLALIAHTLTWERVLGAMPPAEVPEGWAAMPIGFLTSLLD